MAQVGTTVLSREAQFHFERRIKTRTSILKALNEVRAQHECAPLEWDDVIVDTDSDSKEPHNDSIADSHNLECWTMSVQLTHDLLRENGYNYELVALALVIKRSYEMGVAMYDYDQMKVENMAYCDQIEQRSFHALFSKASKKIKWEIHPRDTAVIVKITIWPSLASQSQDCIIPKPKGLI